MVINSLSFAALPKISPGIVPIEDHRRLANNIYMTTLASYRSTSVRTTLWGKSCLGLLNPAVGLGQWCSPEYEIHTSGMISSQHTIRWAGILVLSGDYVGSSDGSKYPFDKIAL